MDALDRLRITKACERHCRERTEGYMHCMTKLSVTRDGYADS